MLSFALNANRPADTELWNRIQAVFPTECIDSEEELIDLYLDDRATRFASFTYGPYVYDLYAAPADDILYLVELDRSTLDLSFYSSLPTYSIIGQGRRGWKAEEVIAEIKLDLVHLCGYRN